MGLSSSLLSEDCNESNNSSTPVTRMLSKRFDPRSPSEGIMRTPIEVVCTPKCDLKSHPVPSLSFDTPKSNKHENVSTSTGLLIDFDIKDDKNENIKEETTTNAVCKLAYDQIVSEAEYNNETTEIEANQSDEIVENSSSNESKSSNFKKQLVYLETDLDAVDGNCNANFSVEHPRVRQLRKGRESLPLNSSENNSTLSTSLFIDDTIDTDTLSAKIDSLSFTEVSFDDAVFMVSDYETERMNDSDDRNPIKDINEWLITIEDNNHSLIPFHIPKDNDENFVNAQKCFTPDQKIRSSKERTPLGCLAQNRVGEPTSGSNNLEKKKWRGIEEERARRGLSLVDENMPPLPPIPFDKVSSAPGKLMRHRRKVDWDRDNTMLI